jgi:hypothetical protein
LAWRVERRISEEGVGESDGKSDGEINHGRRLNRLTRRHAAATDTMIGPVSRSSHVATPPPTTVAATATSTAIVNI